MVGIRPTPEMGVLDAVDGTVVPRLTRVDGRTGRLLYCPRDAQPWNF